MRTPVVSYDRWLEELTIEGVRDQFRDLDVDLVLSKVLGPNNNSKQQVYIVPELNDLAIMPMGTPVAAVGSSAKPSMKSGSSIFSSRLDFSWLTPSGVAPVSDAKLIYYPQYPEVRFSGFLRGCIDPPSHLLDVNKRGKEPGRLLLLGISKVSQKVYGVVVGSETLLAKEFLGLRLEKRGVLDSWPLERPAVPDTWLKVAADLRRISRMGFIPGERLSPRGRKPYRAPNGGGYTLESKLGVVSNALGEPDHHDFEVKQFNVFDLARPRAVRVTLMDLAPDHGLFVDSVTLDFIQQRGRLHAKGHRYDFNGTHIFDVGNLTTGATLRMVGFRGSAAPDADGAILLVSADGVVLMGWSFEKVLDHWRRKHARAVYVPSVSMDIPDPSEPGEATRAYRYGKTVWRGEGTSYKLFLNAIATGAVYFDPALNAKRGNRGGWKVKCRYGFRIKSSSLGVLYHDFQQIDLD